MQENNEIKYLKLEDIIPNRLQPRTEFDEEKLNELATSIKQYGIISPLLVRPVGNKYEIIAGERRFKAAKIVGLTRVPVLITNMDDSTSAEVAVIENIQRQDLSALEEARSYRKLLDQGNITQEQLAKKIGKNQSTIANKMRLLNLCDEVQEALEQNKISERHARSLLQLNNIDDQREILEKIIKERLTVKATESLIKERIQTVTLDSNKNEIENNTPIPSQEKIPTENIYGNDVVNITELNKKELEKENDNMNNNEQNMQMNSGVFPASPNEQQSTPTTTPAFGSRFFPSLEDQEVNVNLANSFGMANDQTAPSSQPMMENLVDPQPVAPPINPSVNIPTFVTDSESLTTPASNQISSMNIPPQPDLGTNIPTPPVSPLAPDNLTTAIPNPNPTGNIIAEPIVNPMASPEPSIPTPITTPIPPVSEPPVAMPTETLGESTMPNDNIPLPQDLNSFPTPNAVVPPETPTPAPELPVEEPKKTTDNIINAINAIKNLGLSIQAIGYQTSIQEEDTPNTYKITIELNK